MSSKPKPKPKPKAKAVVWSEEELEALDKGLRKHGRDFEAIWTERQDLFYHREVRALSDKEYTTRKQREILAGTRSGGLAPTRQSTTTEAGVKVWERKGTKDPKCLANLVKFIDGCGGGASLMDGWEVFTVEHSGSGSAKKADDQYYYSPEGARFRSKQEIACHFNLIKIDPSLKWKSPPRNSSRTTGTENSTEEQQMEKAIALSMAGKDDDPGKGAQSDAFKPPPMKPSAPHLLPLKTAPPKPVPRASPPPPPSPSSIDSVSSADTIIKMATSELYALADPTHLRIEKLENKVATLKRKKKELKTENKRLNTVVTDRDETIQQQNTAVTDQDQTMRNQNRTIQELIKIIENNNTSK
ncbi:hypothetical protein TL16_g03169 [Triparma laevis f. inornata]|uniref:MBD domain-containing protein n=1 Tax=Triparma laevis f. inornata TaxID=1714386 RepID=A0A9W7E0N8_9STRA|nr:hypothetical protein TL16_g03169 [Triparma laevis f. inornata]